MRVEEQVAHGWAVLCPCEHDGQKCGGLIEVAESEDAPSVIMIFDSEQEAMRQASVIGAEITKVEITYKS